MTRLAHGVPIGGELNYLDDGTLGAALQAPRRADRASRRRRSRLTGMRDEFLGVRLADFACDERISRMALLDILEAPDPRLTTVCRAGRADR